MLGKKLYVLTSLVTVLTLCSCNNKIEKIADASGSGSNTEKTALTFLLPEESKTEQLKGIFEDAEKELGITIETDYITSDVDREDIIRSRLASGKMADICYFNSGSLLKELYPAEYFLDLSEEEFTERFDPIFKDAVTIDGAVYGIPFSYYCSVGAVLYNKEVYDQYHLSVPTTWREFLHNCEVIKSAGKTAVIGTFAQEWCTQIPFLADYYNVQKNVPDFLPRYLKGDFNYADDPFLFQSWKKCEDLVPFYNPDLQQLNCQEGGDMLINGDGVHYIMITGDALNYIFKKYEQKASNLGAFAIPDDQTDTPGLTVWPSNSFYINKNSEHIEEALQFFNYYFSEEVIQKHAAEIPQTGPSTIKGISSSESEIPIIKDIQKYIDAGNYCTALEFQVPFKGSGCEHYTKLVGMGQMSAKNAALQYDQSCKEDIFRSIIGQ